MALLNEWSGEGRANIPPVVKAVAVVVGAFLITGIIYFAAQQGMSLASHRIGAKYAPRYSGDDGSQALTPTFAQPLNAPSGYAAVPNRSHTGGVMTFGANGATPVQPVPPPSLAHDPYTSDAERLQARQQLKEVRGTLSVIKQYDARGLWTQIGLLNQARQAEAENVGLGQNVTLVPSDAGGNFRDPEEATQVRNQVTKKILGELEGINAEVALSTHPERFPSPLHNGAEAVGTALRTYLETARMAVAHPEQSSLLKNRSAKELARAEELIRDMESPFGGGASAAN